jgi:hypothetical protein
MEIVMNKKSIGIGSIVLAIVGFIASFYVDTIRDYARLVKANQTEVLLLKQAIDDDDLQWKILQRQSEKNNAQEVEIRVLKILVNRMSNDPNKCFSEIGKTIDQSEEVTIPQSDEVTLPKPSPVPQAGVGSILPPPTQPELPEPPKEDKKTIEELDREIQNLKNSNNHRDWRRDQMIQQKSNF